ncbi:unnamed protein product, partial [Polarella glacialis]
WEGMLQDEEVDSEEILASIREAQVDKARGGMMRKLIVPKWMKLAGLLPAEMKREMEESKRRFSGRGQDVLRHLPRDSGRRMGIGAPTSCSPL